MSDSSSGESSDDSLLASPVFKKRDRRTERASKSKLSFLDACLNGTNARTDAQRRLAEVESEHKEEQNTLENDEEGSPKSQNNDAADADQAKGSDTTHEANNDKGTKRTPNNNATINAPQISTERASIKSDKQKEEDYWDRVESFNSNNKAKMNVGIHADRIQLSDAMNGLDYTSETDDEDGKWNDGIGGMTSDQKRREKRAKLQGLSASIGIRRMFHLTDDNKTKTCGYVDKAEATNELKLIVTALQKRYRNESGNAGTILRSQMLDPLSKIFKKPKDLVPDLLLRFLQRNQIVSGRCEERIVLPKNICQWMWNASCSSYEAVGHISTVCCQNLRRMLVDEIDIDDGISFCADLTFVRDYSISDLVSHLKTDCGLWQSSGPIPSDDENIDHSTGNSSPSVDVYAMKNTFLLWKAALDRDLIKLDMENGDEVLFGGATKAVTALTRVGMDPIFNLANENTNNCIDTLPSLLQSLLSSLIKSTVEQITKLHSKSDAKKWMEYTADRMVEACSNLSAGEEGDADHDDDDGWLPLACAVERIIEFEYGNEEHSLDVIEVKLNFAVLALNSCLAEDDSSDRENQLKQATTRLKDLDIQDDSNDVTKRMMHIAMQALTHAEISLRYIDKNSDEIMRDHPHLLAAVMLSGECAFVGLHTSKLIEMSNLQLEAEKKVALVELMSIIEATCNNIKKKCTSVIAYPHLRRVKEFLTRLGKTIGGMKGKADKRRKRQQGSLDSWRRTSLPLPKDEQDNDLFEFSQDSNCSYLESQDD